MILHGGNMSKHVFLILNYKAHDYTIACVDTIQNLDHDKSIVIVDNGDNTDSYRLLRDLYVDVDNIFVIETKDNLGFARGNNFGYEFIKQKFSECEFIHCLNSDILVNDINTIKKTEEIYAKNKFYILGPNIITGGKETSPIGMMKDETDFHKINKRLKFMTRIYYVIAIFFQRVMGTRLEKIFNSKTSINVQKRMNDYGDVVPILSGCYLVFSKSFMDKYDFLFSDITFLYNEETILTYLLLKDGVRNIEFSKEFDVIHDHAGSSKSNNKQKAKLVLANLKKMENL